MSYRKPSNDSRVLPGASKCAGCEARRQYLAKQLTRLRHRLSLFLRPRRAL